MCISFAWSLKFISLGYNRQRKELTVPRIWIVCVLGSWGSIAWHISCLFHPYDIRYQLPHKQTTPHLLFDCSNTSTASQRCRWSPPRWRIWGSSDSICLPCRIYWVIMALHTEYLENRSLRRRVLHSMWIRWSSFPFFQYPSLPQTIGTRPLNYVFDVEAYSCRIIFVNDTFYCLVGLYMWSQRDGILITQIYDLEKIWSLFPIWTFIQEFSSQFSMKFFTFLQFLISLGCEMMKDGVINLLRSEDSFSIFFSTKNKYFFSCKYNNFFLSCVSALMRELYNKWRISNFSYEKWWIEW